MARPIARLLTSNDALSPCYSSSSSCCRRWICTLPARRLTSSASGVDAIVDAFDLATPTARARDGGPHTRLLRAPRATTTIQLTTFNVRGYKRPRDNNWRVLGGRGRVSLLLQRWQSRGRRVQALVGRDGGRRTGRTGRD